MLGPLAAYDSPRWSFRFLAASWCSPGSNGHHRGESTGGRPLCLSLSQVNKASINQEKEQVWLTNPSQLPVSCVPTMRLCSQWALTGALKVRHCLMYLFINRSSDMLLWAQEMDQDSITSLIYALLCAHLHCHSYAGP